MLSVIMSTYNGAKTLRKAIKSIQEQSYKDFELLVCDDASTDDSLAIVRDMAESDKRIRIIQNSQNRGLQYSLNKCLQVAKNPIIARMDDDDLAVPNRFEKQLQFLNNHLEFALVGSNIEMFDENGIYGVQRLPVNPNYNDLFLGNPFAHPTVMYRKEAVMAVNGYSEGAFVDRIEDYDLWFKLYAAGYKGANLPITLLQYREDRNSFSKRTLHSRFNIVRLYIRNIQKARLGFRAYLWVFRAILKMMIPSAVYRLIHNFRYRKA